MASSRRVLLRLQGDSGDARRAVAEVRSDLRRMSREEAEVRLDIQTARVERQIESVKRQLADLSRQKSSPAVDLKTTRAEERLALLQLRLDRLSLKKVNIDVDIRRGGIERAASALGTVERGVGNVTRGFGDAARAIPVFGQIFATVLGGAVSLVGTLAEGLGSLASAGITGLANSFKSLSGLGALAAPIGGIVAALAGIAVQGALAAAVLGGLAIALNAVLGAVVALAGALVALVASLTAAAAGLGALAVAFGGVLIPVVAVAVGLFTRFAAILKARQAQQQELAQATQQQKTAERAVTDALAQRKQAEESLAEAVVSGRKAMAQAAIDEHNAELALENSKLGLKGARLGVLEAKKELKDLLTQAGVTGKGLDRLVKQFSDVHVDPTNLQSVLSPAQNAGATKKLDPLALQRAILNVQLAQQGVKNAVNDTANAERNLGEATKKRTDFARQGLNAYKPYRQALERVRQAEIRLARAQDRTSAAQRKYQQALKGLSGTEKTTLSNLDKFLKAFKDLAKAFTDPIFRALNDVFDTLSGKAGFLKGALTQVGEAMGGAIRAFGAFLAQPATITAFQKMATGAANLIRELGGRGLVAGATILREIAVTAMPALVRGAHAVSDALARIAGQPGKIHSATRAVIDQFRSWARLAGSLLGLVKDIFIPAAGAGQNLADSMRHVVDRWREWIRANPEKVREFFRISVRRAKDIFNAIKSIASWLKNDLPKAAGKASTAFHNLYKAIKPAFDLLDEFVNKLEGSTLEKILLPLSPKGSSPVKGLTPEQTKNLTKGGHKITFDSGTEEIDNILGNALKKLTKKPRLSPNEPRSRTASTAGVVHHHYEIIAPAGKTPDPVAAIAKIHHLVQLKG